MTTIAAQSFYASVSVAATRDVAAKATPASAGDASTEGPSASGGDSAVVITLSIAAQAFSVVQESAPSNYYAQFFRTRDGSPANALGAAVADPGSVSSSAGKTFAQVTADARARMDAKYGAMNASGKPFDFNSWEGRDWYTLFGDLDRRSLYAVASNAGGLFSKDEQDVAKSIMTQQQGLAMGLYSGPTSLAGNFADPFVGDYAARMKAGIAFLDNVSPEEKGSFDWAKQRASVQFSYETEMRRRGEEPEKLDSGSALVKMIKAAMDNLRDLNDPSKSLEDMPQYKQAETYYAAAGGQPPGPVDLTA
jgi:hypothetical protein